MDSMHVKVRSSPCVYSDFGGYRDYHQELDAAKILDDSLINNMACAHEFDREWIEKISFWTELWRDDKAQFESIGDQLQNFVSDFYSIDNHIHEQIHFYNDLIDQKREREFARIDKESAKYDVDILR
jgi:hypothetical protein